MIHIRSVRVNLVRSTLDGCIVVRSMSSSIFVLGWQVRPIPASLIPAGTPVFLANSYTQNRVIQHSFCAAAIQSLDSADSTTTRQEEVWLLSATTSSQTQGEALVDRMGYRLWGGCRCPIRGV